MPRVHVTGAATVAPVSIAGRLGVASVAVTSVVECCAEEDRIEMAEIARALAVLAKAYTEAGL